MRIAAVLMIIATCAVSSVVGISKSQIVSFAPPLVAVAGIPVRVTYIGSNFDNNTKFRLSTNATRCNEGINVNPATTPTDTVGSVVSWTSHDPKSFAVVEFFTNKARTQVFVCYSRDSGRKWYRAFNSKNRAHFKIWRIQPVATIFPLTPTAGQPVYVSVRFLPAFSKGVLVDKPDGCNGETPLNMIKGCNSTKATRDNVFSFTPRVSVTTAFLCVATETKDWALVPYDPAKFQVYNEKSQPTTEKLLPTQSFTIYDSIIRYQRASIVWTPLIAGAYATATISLRNKTQLTIVASDFKVVEMADGSGTRECPVPVVVQGTSTTVAFSFLPQRWGNSGYLKMTYKSRPLFFELSTEHVDALKRPNNTVSAIPSTMLDQSITRFIVQPGYAMLDTYSSTSLATIFQFTPLTNWVLATGVPMTNGTAADEVKTLTLKTSTTTAIATQLVTIPASSTKCRFRLDYYFNASTYDMTASNYIGRVAIVVRNSSADMFIHKTFNLYTYGLKIFVTGGVRNSGQDGDAFSWERLGTEFVVASTYASARIEIEIYHGSQMTLLFGNPYFQCSNAARTPPEEVTALKRILTNVGTVTTHALLRWRDSDPGALFRGDPCLTAWQGVRCRNLRVVGLELANMRLSGVFPNIEELTLLEYLDLRNNSLTGVAANFNNSRLTHVFLSRNRITSIPTTLFSAASHQCLISLHVASNFLSAFPSQVVGHPTLQQLVLSGNFLGTRMPDLASNAALVHLDVSRNNFAFRLPTLPSGLLISADLSQNRFVGSIPVQWQQLRNVQLLDVSKNNLNGTVPLELSRIASGRRLTFRGESNFFSGLLPNLPFSRVDIRNNMFQCPIPVTLAFVRERHVIGVGEANCDYSRM